jgi:hypothetical protein
MLDLRPDPPGNEEMRWSDLGILFLGTAAMVWVLFVVTVAFVSTAS